MLEPSPNPYGHDSRNGPLKTLVREIWDHPTLYLTSSCAAILLAGILFLRIFNPQVYQVRSDSMCPTICEGEKILANLSHYHGRPPRRGDVIIFRHKSTANLHIKRVAAVGGDVFSISGQKILVNGKSFDHRAPSKDCTAPEPQSTVPSLADPFEPVRMPEGSLFVVGDNLEHSFDSRYPGFGFVTTDQVRGKPLLIYWSPIGSRIGCSIE